MIPWRLNIAGIRDFPPQSIDLSGEKEHIGILGPNGVGKSTLSFCMGAVLHSGKVDIGGLRSANLPDERLWRASISFLFKNEGEIKVDAPKFVQFDLYIEQTFHGTIAREYTIAAGDQLDQWEEVTVYKSGDKIHSFSAYKKLLQTKYHLDPDYYYLIWYQNEVNQFSEMAPEERFRIFSEMHGIDQIQKNWEESRELVQEAEAILEEAKLQQENRKFQLNIQKRKLDQYVDNQKRLTEGFGQYYGALSVLIHKTKEEIDRYSEEEATIEEQIEDVNERLRVYEMNQEEQKLQLQTKQSERRILEEQVQILETELNEIRNQHKEYKDVYDKLDQELADIRKETSSIPDEKTVDQRLEESQKELERLNPLILQEEESIRQLRMRIQEANEEVTELNYVIKRDQDREMKTNQLLALYESSHYVEQQIKNLDERIFHHKDGLKEFKQRLKSYKQEQLELNKNELNSPRQKEAKQYFAKQGIEAYTLRELIKLTDHVKLSDEKEFDAIKYTIFVNSRTFTPPNDLYYVSLPAIVPKEYIMQVPAKHVAVRDDLPSDVVPLAIRALWWVKSFYDKENTVTLANGSVRDEKGLRGPQEKPQYILSLRAVQERIITLASLIDECEKRINETILSIGTDEKEVANLRNIIGDVREAEAFVADEKNRLLRQNRLDQLQNVIEQDRHMEQQHMASIKKWESEKSDVNANLELYLSFKRIWEKFAGEKAKIGELQQLQQRLADMETEINKQKNLLDIRSAEYDMSQEECAKLERNLKQITLDIQDGLHEKKELNRQLKNKSEEKEAQQKAYFQYNEERNELEQIAPTKVREEQEKMVELPNWNLFEARQYRETGKAMFTQAVNEKDIDANAPDNYQRMKEAYDGANIEVNESQALLQQNRGRMEHIRRDLDSTISGKVLLIDKHFVTYMDQFGFEGELDWDMQEDKKGTMRYYLYLKAKKYGHKMAMEDVSIKARGGRHGVGLSGGEKSLVSLLYALALLQTIQTNPSFIVLDEFDSALDEGRKVKVFDLYVNELGRKMIVLTPKSHDKDYMSRFHKAYVIYHRPEIPESGIMKVRRKAEIFERI